MGTSRKGKLPMVDASASEPASAQRQFLDLLAEEYCRRLRRGEHPSTQEYMERHPHLAGEIRELLTGLKLVEGARQDPQGSSTVTPPSQIGESAPGVCSRKSPFSTIALTRDQGSGKIRDSASLAQYWTLADVSS